MTHSRVKRGGLMVRMSVEKGEVFLLNISGEASDNDYEMCRITLDNVMVTQSMNIDNDAEGGNTPTFGSSRHWWDYML